MKKMFLFFCFFLNMFFVSANNEKDENLLDEQMKSIACELFKEELDEVNKQLKEKGLDLEEFISDYEADIITTYLSSEDEIKDNIESKLLNQLKVKGLLQNLECKNISFSDICVLVNDTKKYDNKFLFNIKQCVTFLLIKQSLPINNLDYFSIDAAFLRDFGIIYFCYSINDEKLQKILYDKFLENNNNIDFTDRIISELKNSTSKQIISEEQLQKFKNFLESFKENNNPYLAYSWYDLYVFRQILLEVKLNFEFHKKVPIITIDKSDNIDSDIMDLFFYILKFNSNFKGGRILNSVCISHSTLQDWTFELKKAVYLQKQDSSKKVLIPLNLNQKHWVTVFIHNNQVDIVDSLKSPLAKQDYIDIIVKKLNEESQIKFQAGKVHSANQQTGDNSCAIYTIFYMMILEKHGLEDGLKKITELVLKKSLEDILKDFKIELNGFENKFIENTKMEMVGENGYREQVEQLLLYYCKSKKISLLLDQNNKNEGVISQSQLDRIRKIIPNAFKDDKGQDEKLSII